MLNPEISFVQFLIVLAACYYVQLVVGGKW